MALRTPKSKSAAPDLAEFQHVNARVVSEHGIHWCEVVVNYHDHGHEAYLLLSDIADMIQQNDLSFDAAVRSALSTFEALLTRSGSLSAERQVGLYGELLFLASCIGSLPPDIVISAWKGHGGHEHDFVFDGACFEIKTTKSEKRHHRIGGLEQLQPLPNVPLWLVSVQLTAAAPGSGRTLPQLIDDVRAAAGAAAPNLNAGLIEAGWRDRDRGLYRDPQSLRSVPTAYKVDARFPVLDRSVVDEGCARSELIIDASYVIDVTSLAARVPPAPADHFVQGS